MKRLTFFSSIENVSVNFKVEYADWLVNRLAEIKSQNSDFTTFGKFKNSFEENFEDFEIFWYSSQMGKITDLGLLVL